MPGGRSDVVLKDLHTLFRVGAVGGLTDGQLLERFLRERDDAGEAAFRALIERHAPMVLRICRDVLADWHEAEDASQATFIVLACKAGSIRKRDSIASWLFGVACRVAAQAKAKSARRRRHEERNAGLAAAKIVKDDPRVDWLELYEEIDRLPEHLRAPLVLCYWNGHSQPEAAAQLDCPVRTLQNRLARGRDRLRSRLTRRGLSSWVGLWEASMGQRGDSLPVSTAWLETTVRAALKTVHYTSAVGAISASVTTLTEGTLKLMFCTKLKSIVRAALSIGVLAAGMGLLVYGSAGARVQQPRASEPALVASPESRKDDPSRKAKEQGGEIVVQAFNLARTGEDDGLSGTVAVDPKTGKWRSIFKGISLNTGPVSPDGRYIVYSSFSRAPDDQVGIWIYDMNGEMAPRRIFEQKGEPHWTNNGQAVVIATPVGQTWKRLETWRVNADGTGRVKLPISETDVVVDCSRDGTWLATRTAPGEATHRGRLTLVHPDGTGARYLTEDSPNDLSFSFTTFKISPDGLSVAYVDLVHSRLFVVDIEGKKRREIPIPIVPGTMFGVWWSPDGSRLALNWNDSDRKEGSIALVDLDGSNFRTLPLPPGRWNLSVSDWTTLTPGLRVGAPDQHLDLKTARGRYEALVLECTKASQAFREELQKAKTDDERNKIKREKSWQPRRYISRFLEVGESASNDPAAADALIWVVKYGFDGPEFSRAIDRLVQNHVERRNVGDAASTLQYSVSPSAEKLLRAVIEKNPDPTFKGWACLALGRYFEHWSERVRRIRDDPESAKALAAMFLEEAGDKEYFSRFVGRDPDKLMKEAEAAFERTIKEFGDTSRRGDSLKKHAQGELYEIRELRAGKPAPEITGQDIDGRPLKLSDFKRKVVVIDFWTTSCGACRVMNAYERQLVKRMRGKPFALLGVNCDGDEDKLREWIKKEEITWPSWRDGNDDNAKGPIFRQFNIHGWPTLYILDHRGVIRHKFLDFPGNGKLDMAIDALVQEAEREAARSKKD
jgi:RNA polymerase sigma factor (sigma-70 family)